MATNGQTINDRINAMKYALVGQGLARTVCKATTEEVIAPKKKHLDYLIACSEEPNVSIPQLANLLFERTMHSSWAVAFKALITIHKLICSGNERFTQYLATSNHSFAHLSDFMDRSTPQGYGMSSFVRTYAAYINEKVLAYRTLAIDICKIKQGADNALRLMNMEHLGKTLPIVQSQFDALLNFKPEVKDLSNGIIMGAFRALYKDLVKIYVAYQEAIINLLERYFKLSRKKTRDALSLYKEYLARMDKVESFLKLVDAVGLDKSEMPDVVNSPASILPALEQHLAQLEAEKKGHGTLSTNAEQESNSDLTAKTNEENGADEDEAKADVESEQVTETTKPAAKQPPPKPPAPAPVSAPKDQEKISPKRPAPPPHPPAPKSPKSKAEVASDTTNIDENRQAEDVSEVVPEVKEELAQEEKTDVEAKIDEQVASDTKVEPSPQHSSQSSLVDGKDEDESLPKSPVAIITDKFDDVKIDRVEQESSSTDMEPKPEPTVKTASPPPPPSTTSPKNTEKPNKPPSRPAPPVRPLPPQSS